VTEWDRAPVPREDRSPSTEKEWMAQLKELAVTLGWSWYHPFLSIHSDRGFPDVTLVRERIVYVECKTDVGKLTVAQKSWLARLSAAGGEVRVWRPADWDEAVAVLSRRDA
jgi:hypothetical protein